MNNEDDPIIYIPHESLRHIFLSIEEFLQKENDPVPTYSLNREACEKVTGVLDRITHDYYLDFYDKAAYLFWQLAKDNTLTTAISA